MVNNKTWGVAFGKFYCATYMILIVNGNLLTHLKHAEGMSLHGESLFGQVREIKSCLRISGERRAPRVELWRR